MAVTAVQAYAMVVGPRESLGRRRVAMAVAAAVFGGIATLLALVWMSPRETQSVADAHAARPASDSPAVVESAPPPTWSGSRQATWARDGSKTIAFELQATNTVAAWMKPVRPLLVVRCVWRTTEVFVAIGSSASIESQAGSHTVRLQIDDQKEVVQQWSDSESGQELFAPNAEALVRRLAGAQQMRFAFTPFNAQPAVAEFSVQGFDKLAGLVASTCGWRLDDSAAAQSARLSR